MNKKLFLVVILATYFSIQSTNTQEIALSFDDAPMSDSEFFKSSERTEKLIALLKKLDIRGAMIFSNPCKDEKKGVAQLKKYSDAGHFIANHTCSHPRFNDVGLDTFIADTDKADKLLSELMKSQKYFRFPYLNEGADEKNRDKMRIWLKDHNYRNGLVSIDDDDYVFSSALNKAKKQKRKINLKEIQSMYVNHLVGAVEFYDQLAKDKMGYNPKHVILLHENDSTVLFLEAFVNELKKKGWKFISAQEAYKDKLYLETPKNTYANNGIIAQVALEKTGIKSSYNKYDELRSELIKKLGIK